MHKLKLFLLGALTFGFLCIPQQSKAGAADIPYLMELIIQSSQLGATAAQVYKTVDEMKEEVMKVIKVANAIVDMYQESQELIAASDQTITIYKVYLETLTYISKNQIYLTNAQIDVLIKTMDAAAFDLAADDSPRPKGLKRVAGGALENLPQLIKWMTDAQGSNIMDFVNLMDITTDKIQTCRRKTESASRYCRSVIRQAKIHAGVYDLQEVIDNFKRRYN
ncbi:hypothetical protein [Bacteroides acidifaciens]|uniref:hypothetical protein n=1 Tax=Bacteroides acidifaciens TaxID=85831 RepID=UPI0025918807|nr:hypothetical protein [Bacteroides acidifaciens]